MTLSLFDSHSQSLREFVPIQAGWVGIYLCGPTVQSSPHVGHLRSALVYDQLRRWLTAKGLKVTLVRNVTDIDDKVLANAEGADEPWWALAYRIEQEFNEAYSALGIERPTYEPRATASIPEMLALIERLIEAGYAYRADDGSADVYFSAAKWADYGELTNQRLDDMNSEDAGEVGGAEARGKRDPRDFALWKAHKASEPDTAAWQSPFGAGRPGWHIECSAMSMRYLGEHFDIHGGGLDLRFPHHENELAQSRAAGAKFANFWLHNGLVNIAGNKMSKSLGNSIFARDLFAAGSALAVRYYLGSAHYRSVLDYHAGVLDEAQAAIDRIAGFLARASRGSAGDYRFDFAQLPAAFIEAMDEDLAIPQALAALHETVRAGNSALDAGDTAAADSAFKAVKAMVQVLGIDPSEPQWSAGSADSATHKALDSVIQGLIAERNQARANKDFARSDAIRDQLNQAGISLEDAADSTRWSING